LPRTGFLTYPPFADLDAGGTIEAAARMGYRSIELGLDVLGLTDANARVDLRSLVRLGNDAGAPIRAVAALADPLSGDETQRKQRAALIRRAVEVAGAAGVPLVSVYTGPDTWDAAAPSIPRDLGIDEAWSRVDAAFVPLLPVAEQAGVTVCFKPIMGTLAYDGASTMTLAARYRHSKAFGLTFDPSHFALHGDDLGTVVRDLGRSIKNVHLKDAFGRPGLENRDYHFPPLGTGQVDWRALLDALDAIGYEGPLHVLNECGAYIANVLGGDAKAAAKAQLADWGRIVAGLGRA
jgi:sugar phosphate isomerase/epimerase